MVNYKTTTTPMLATEKLGNDSSQLLSPEASTGYQSLVGTLQYVTLSRSDISFLVN